MRQIILILNIAALMFSVAWMIKSNYEFEPLILTITLVATLIGLIYNKDFLSSSNKSTIKGNKNKVTQGNKKSNITVDKSNESSIDGNENKVNQKN